MFILMYVMVIHLLSMVIPDICHICRIHWSQCPFIHLSWTTQRTTSVGSTSLFKSVGLPCLAAKSHAVVQTSPGSRAGREATSIRSTNGCDTLGGASLVWGGCQCLRPRSGE